MTSNFFVSVVLVVCCAHPTADDRHTRVPTARTIRVTERVIQAPLFSALRLCNAGLVPYGSNDEPLGGRADEIERITGDERQGSNGRRVEHRDVLGLNDPQALDVIRLTSFERLELDRVAGD